MTVEYTVSNRESSHKKCEKNYHQINNTINDKGSFLPLCKVVAIVVVGFFISVVHTLLDTVFVARTGFEPVIFRSASSCASPITLA